MTQSSRQQYIGAGIGILSALVLNAGSMYITIQISTAVALEKINRIESDIAEIHKTIHGNGQPGLSQQLEDNRRAISRIDARLVAVEVITDARERRYSDGR